MPKVILTRPHAGHQPGTTLEVADGTAASLVGAGIARPAPSPRRRPTPRTRTPRSEPPPTTPPPGDTTPTPVPAPDSDPAA